MSWTAPTTRATGDLITAAIWNADVVNDLAYLKGTEYPSEVDVTNTAVETTLLSHTITGGSMGTTGIIQAILGGDLLGNDSPQATLRVKLGATTIWADQFSAAFAASATRRPWEIGLRIANLSSASVQFMNGTVRVGQAGGTSSGLGGLQAILDGSIATSVARGVVDPIGGSAAEDTASDKALVVTVQWSGASSSVSWRKKWACAKLL